MTKNSIIKIKENQANTRLDILLSENLDISRSQAQKFIKQEQIYINDELPKKFGVIVKKGDVVLFKKEIEKAIKKPDNFIHKKNSTETMIVEPQIIAKTADYIVVNKPTGLLTHPTQANEKNTLAGWVVKKFPKNKGVGEDPIRPGIVHRLDKEASGLLVIARTQEMFEHLKSQFKNRTIEKEYVVLAHGRIEKDNDIIDFPISRSENSEKMAAVPKTVKGLPSDAGKEATTEIDVEKRFINFTLLKVKIYTGRTHQIRAHLFAYNHPIVGDPLYFHKKQKKTWDKKCGRLFLHCTRLSFTDLDGYKQTFESTLPKELENFIKTIKN